MNERTEHTRAQRVQQTVNDNQRRDRAREFDLITYKQTYDQSYVVERRDTTTTVQRPMMVWRKWPLTAVDTSLERVQSVLK